MTSDPLGYALKLYLMVKRELMRPGRYTRHARVVAGALAWLDERIPGFTEKARAGVCPVCGRRFTGPRYLAAHLDRTPCGAIVVDEIYNYVLAREREKRGAEWVPPPPSRLYVTRSPAPRPRRCRGGRGPCGGSRGGARAPQPRASQSP